MCPQKTANGVQHFILTRFNILLWSQDKEGKKVRTTKWLEHRFTLFERYCLPSIKNQTCQNFVWIVLFDSKTPDHFKERIAYYQMECPQLIPVYVEPEKGLYFADIFRTEIIKRLNAERVITTYLDNDDALNVMFVEDIQKRAVSAIIGTFFYYEQGYQLYTDNMYLIQINYTKNHFVSVVEKGDVSTLKGIFGYGSHFYIDKIANARIEFVKNLPMWCEVVHEKNIINDANFILHTKMVRDENRLRQEFAIDETVKYGIGIYLHRFLPRYIKTFRRRAKRLLTKI